MKYRKKPVVVEALQFLGSEASACAIEGFTMGRAKRVENHRYKAEDNSILILISTLEGIMTADPGYWIIKGINGEFYPCKPDIFQATYEPVE